MQIVEGEVLATMEHDPRSVLREAQAAAKALRDVVSQKPNKVMMNGEQFLEVEDWQTLGHFYGITGMGEGDPEFVSFEVEPGSWVRGFKASAVALRGDKVISRATAFCLSDEEKWGARPKYEWCYALKNGGTSVDDPGSENIVWEENPNKEGKKRPKKIRVQTGMEPVPMFQLASMAQTRCLAKVHRNILSWVVVLAGYKPTPAEELDGMTQREPQAPPTPPPPQREPGEDDGPPPEPERKAAEAPRPSGDKLPCPKCKKPAGPSKFPKPGASHFCFACREGFSK